MASRVEEVSGLIRSLAWPSVALLAIYLFYRPLETTLTTISERSSDIENIKLGSLELKIRASELPKSTAAVAKSIVGLPEKGMIMLLEIGQYDGHGYCRGTSESSYERYDEDARKPLNDLKVRGLIQIEEKERPNDTSCTYELFATLTDQGRSSRSFIIELITAQLKDASPSPAQ